MSKVALVTGGSRGIGAAISKALQDAGYTVAATYAGNDDAAKAFTEETGIKTYKWSVADYNACAAGIKQIEEDLGPIAVLVNNAGITRDATMRKMTEQQFDDIIAIHLKGTWNGTRAAAGRMREHGGGAIVNVSSISGKVGLMGQTNYSAAKAGIVGLTKAAAKEVAFKGVRVNAIQPGLIRTAMTLAMPQQVWDEKMAEIPMGRAAEPSEVAQVVLFLASDMSSYMTGTVLEITGGRHI